MRHDWVVNRSNEIKRLAKLYQNKKAAFRELVTNSIDAYERKDILYAQKGQQCTSEKFIKVMMPEGTSGTKFGCVDFATGIEDLKQFSKLFESAKQGEALTAGEFGIGRIACFGLTINIEGYLEYITNNGDVERVLTVDTEGFDDDDPVSSNNGRLKKQGCCVFVHKVDMSLLPSTKDLVKYLSGVFGLRILRDPRLKILVNNEKIGINKELESFKKVVMIAEFYYDEQKVTVEGNIQAYNSGTGSLWIYKKNIRIGNTVKDIGLDYHVKGWINCDSFELTGGRDDVIEDALYEMVKKGIQQFLEKGNFKKIEKDKDDQISPIKSKHLITKMTGMLDSILSNNAFKERFNMPQIITQQEKEVEVDTWHDPGILESLEKAKQAAGIGTNKGYSLTGGNGAQKGDKVEGFRADGHTKHIKPGDGGGIHTDARIENRGKIPTISTPTIPPSTKPGSPQESPYYTGNDQLLKQKQKILVDTAKPGGFEFVELAYGDGRPPIFIKGNRVVLNTSNKIFKACIQHELGIISILSMAMAHMFKDYTEVDAEMKDGYIYEVMNFHLKNMGYWK